jgi:hypothetical protein
MPKIITNLTKAPLSLYVAGAWLNLPDGGEGSIGDADYAVLEKSEAFAGLVKDGRIDIAGKPGRPAKDDAKAKAAEEAAAKAKAEDDAKAESDRLAAEQAAADEAAKG